jgi:hypothetical protein
MLALQWTLHGWNSIRDARTLLGSGVRALAKHDAEGFSFAAGDMSDGGIKVRRSAVLLRDGAGTAAVLFDVASVPFSWSFSGEGPVHRLQEPRSGSETTCALASTDAADTVRGVDLLGAQWREWVVLFHTGLHVAQSSLSFDAAAGSRYLLTGLGPGYWDVWRDGWLEEMGIPVRPPAASLRFDSGPGSFFIRKFG